MGISVWALLNDQFTYTSLKRNSLIASCFRRLVFGQLFLHFQLSGCFPCLSALSVGSGLVYGTGRAFWQCVIGIMLLVSGARVPGCRWKLVYDGWFVTYMVQVHSIHNDVISYVLLQALLVLMKTRSSDKMMGTLDNGQDATCLVNALWMDTWN